jgi:putative transposase
MKNRGAEVDHSTIQGWAVNRINLWNKSIKIRRCKYLNNWIEQDHINIKRRIAIDSGFKEFESAQRKM